MHIHARNSKDFWAGVMFLLIGSSAIVLARNYQFGGTANMGPGFFPMLLGGLLVVLGAILVLRGLRFTHNPEQVPPFRFRPLFVILVSVVLFGVLLQPLGMVVCSVLLVVLSSYATHEFHLREAIVSALVLTAFTTMVFVWGLRMPIPLWPDFLGT